MNEKPYELLDGTLIINDYNEFFYNSPNFFKSKYHEVVYDKVIFNDRSIKLLNWSNFKKFIKTKELILPSSVKELIERGRTDNIDKCTIICEKSGENIHNLIYDLVEWCYFERNLTVIPIDESYIIKENKMITKTRKVINVGEFHDYELLGAVILNEGLQTIETEAFYNCYRIKKIYIPSTVTHIGCNAFRISEKYKSKEVKVYIESKSPIKKLTKKELLARFNDNSTFFLVNTIIRTSDISNINIKSYDPFYIDGLELIVDSYFTDDDIGILSSLKIINNIKITIDSNYRGNFDNIYKLSEKMHLGTKIIYPEVTQKDIQVKTSDLSKKNIDAFNEFNRETLKLIVDSDLTKENILLINNLKYLRYLNVSNITEEERDYILQYLKSNIILYNYINDENIELSFNGGVLSNGIEYEFNKNKIISMNIYVDKNFKISKLNKFLELNTFDNLRNITIIGASGIKQVFIALRMFCPENVILTFRDKKFIEEIKHNSNSPKLDNTDNLVINSEIDYLKKEIIKIATKSNSVIKEKILHKLNELISEYNTNIDEYNKKDEEVLTLMPNYISIDIDILTRLKRLYESLSDKNYLIDLLNKIQDKNISIIKDIEALLNKISSIDKELIYSMIDGILNKYKLLIEKDISIENKDVNLTLNNYNYEVEMDKELINILEILNSYYYEVKKYYTELDKINYYIDLLNDNKQIVIRDNIVDLITLLKTTNTKEVIIEFKKILDRYVCVLKDTMENIKERYLLNKSVNVEDIINIKLDFLQDVKKWLKNFGLIIQLDKIYDVLNKRDSNIIKLDIGLDYGVCIYDLIKEINNLLEHTQLNEIIYNKINELLEEYKMIIQTKDNKEILKAQRNIISELCKIKTDIEINIKKEGTTRQHIQLVKI